MTNETQQLAKPNTGELADLRKALIENVRKDLDPSQEGIVRECFREVEGVILSLPLGYFSDEIAPPESGKDWSGSNRPSGSFPGMSIPVSGADSGVREALKEATQAQHFDLPKGEPARFVRNGVLETCQCADCAALASSGNAGALDPVTVEACAKVCEEIREAHTGTALSDLEVASDECVRAIRALIGQPAPASNASKP